MISLRRAKEIAAAAATAGRPEFKAWLAELSFGSAAKVQNGNAARIPPGGCPASAGR
jgi:hypothetical protein